MIVAYFPHDACLIKIQELTNGLLDLEQRFTTLINANITDLTIKHDKDIADVIAAHKKDINDLTTKHNQDITNLTNKINQDVTSINNSISNLIANLSTNHGHAATKITTDATHRFVTDVQINNWNSKANGTHYHDDRYYTEAEINNMINTINTSINQRPVNVFYAGPAAPAQTNIIWINTNNGIPYGYYNGSWQPFGAVWK